MIHSLEPVSKSIGEKPFNLVHLGPGDGIEIPYLFKKFQKRIAIYAGVDLSEEIIKNTARLNQGLLSQVNDLWYLTDLEAKKSLERVCYDIKQKSPNRNLLVVTGCGTLCSNPEMFRNLHNSLEYDDFLYLTFEGDDFSKRKETFATYDSDSARDLLSVGLEMAGYNPKEGQFRTIFNDDTSRIEVYFKPKDESEILCLASYKPKEEELNTQLNQLGFQIEFLEFYSQVHTFAVLCKRRRKLDV